MLSQSPSDGGLLAVTDSSLCTELLSCALLPRGTVVCWSPNVTKQLPLTDVTQLVAGDNFYCALDAKGKVVCWESDECKPAPEGEGFTELRHNLGPVKRLVAAGHTLCLLAARGPT